MQQRPACRSPHVIPRPARAALALGAMLAALPFAGRPVAGRFAPSTGAAGVSTGNVVARLAPALPHRERSAIARARGAGNDGRGGDALAVALGAAWGDIRGAAPTPEVMTPRQRLALDAPGTYIGDVLRARDSAVVRWPERVDRPLTVWIANAAGVPGWRPAYLARVADAFTAWTRTGVPVHFRFVQDSGAAEVHVSWTDRFHEPISGRTVWMRDQNWWMTDANITLALHHTDGNPLDEDQVRAIALHEVGHLLGLDHTSDSTSVMAARVRVRELSSADQATARLVYALPAGHL